MRVELKYPIEANGETVSILELRRPTVKHLKALDNAKGDIAKTATLISELAGIPPSSVDKIDAEDFAAIGEVINGFFGTPPPTGGR